MTLLLKRVLETQTISSLDGPKVSKTIIIQMSLYDSSEWKGEGIGDMKCMLLYKSWAYKWVSRSKDLQDL